MMPAKLLSLCDEVMVKADKLLMLPDTVTLPEPALMANGLVIWLTSTTVPE
jgi:hypothetical protein